MAKLAPGDLAQVLSKLPKQNNENIIIGYEDSDDAGVFRLNEEFSLIQTLDFFTPIADEPELYGKIAAINSLNDVYAMGGTPLTALSIVCYPQKGDWEILGEILRGGQETLNAENVYVLGGHSVDDSEIKFGYSITGIVASNKVIANSGARGNDCLILTKPVGTGIISTGIKFEKASRNAKTAALESMTESARFASKVMTETGANGCTDITGFGLLGHAYEMAKASRVTFEINSKLVPLLPDVEDLVEQKMLTRGDKNNRAYVGETVEFSENVSSVMQSILFDPQTAGGLLISLEEEKAEIFLEQVENASIIGRVRALEEKLLKVI